SRALEFVRREKLEAWQSKGCMSAVLRAPRQFWRLMASMADPTNDCLKGADHHVSHISIRFGLGTIFILLAAYPGMAVEPGEVKQILLQEWQVSVESIKTMRRRCVKDYWVKDKGDSSP